MSEALLLFGHVVLAALTGYILYVSYRSYRRYDDAVLGMIFIGFLFIGIGTAGVGVLEHVLGLPRPQTEAVMLVSHAVGFGFIVIAIRG